MVDPNISEQEKICIRILAAYFQQGSGALSRARQVLQEKGLSLNQNEYVALMRMMEGYGVISSPTHTVGANGGFFMFQISPESVRIARELDSLDKKAQEPRDIVSQVNEKARKHPVAAWVVISLIVGTTVLAFINQVVQFLKNFGLMQ